MRLLALVIAARRPCVVRPGYAGHLAAWPDAVAITPDAVTMSGGSPAQAGDQSTAPSARNSGLLPAQEHGSLRDADLLVLASPANPDGRVTDPALLRTLAQRMTVVVDEAYADPAPGLCPEAGDRLIVLRSFGKFYGLPGLRLGFVIAGTDLAPRLRALLGDWPVSSAAVAIGTAAYRDQHWHRAQQARITETGGLLDEVLRNARLDIVGSAPLFRLVACADATKLFETLAHHAILTRPFADQPDRLRIGLPRGAAGLVRLATALEEFPR
jgi:cobalamin biosynthetic protein CobC